MDTGRGPGAAGRRPLRAVTAGLAAAVGLTGCASLGPDASAAADVAEGLHAAVAAGDGAAACRLLAPATAEQLEQDAGADCPDAVLAADLPSASALVRADAYGRQAQVVLTGDVVFLALSGADWVVTAAGCSPRPERPYDCRVTKG